MQYFFKLYNFLTNNIKRPEWFNKERLSKWLNKDRFWTLIFCFGMSGGIALGVTIGMDGFIFSGLSIILGTIIGIPTILKKFNGTKFIGSFNYTNSEGQILTEEQRPYYAVLWTTIGHMAFIVGLLLPTILRSLGFPIDPFETYIPINFFTIFIRLLSMIAPVTVYFLYKNCPISIVFNSKYYTIEGSTNTLLFKKYIQLIKDNKNNEKNNYL